MDGLRSRLLLYGDLDEDGVLCALAAVYHDWRHGCAEREQLVRRLNHQAKALLEQAAHYGLRQDLWRGYLAWLLATAENPFSLAAERRGLPSGSLSQLALADMQVFAQLLRFDFSSLERDLGLNCLSLLQNYQPPAQMPRDYAQRSARLLHELSQALTAAEPQQLLQLLANWYRDHGAGRFSLEHGFRLRRDAAGELELLPVNNAAAMQLSDLVGCERQTAQLRANTEAFLRGQAANNALLYGDSGCGKSSAVKALLNEYGARGLRMIELYKHQFRDLSQLIGLLKRRNYYFIIFIDDLSFEEDEVEYKFLKAVIEGGVESRPDNVLIYATSNRRHLIREMWADRDDMEHDGDVHRSDTMEERLSLASRFGVQIHYPSPDRQLFWQITQQLAARRGLDIETQQLRREADQWSLRQGGRCGRAAQQLIDRLSGQTQQEPNDE